MNPLRLIHHCVECSGLTSWPGCASPGLRRMGPVKYLLSAQAAYANVPECEGTMLDDFAGKYPDLSATETTPTTLMEQWSICDVVPGMEKVADEFAMANTLRTMKKLGGVMVKIGYPSSLWKVLSASGAKRHWFNSVKPMLLAGVPYISDGGSLTERAADPYPLWAKEFGIEQMGEGMPEVGGPFDRSDFTAMATGMVFHNRIDDALKLKCKMIFQWRTQENDGTLDDAISLCREYDWPLLLNLNPGSDDEKGHEILDRVARAAQGEVA